MVSASSTVRSGFNLFGNAPTNASSQFYAGLNDGALTMTTGNDRALFIDGFEFSFIPAVLGFYDEGEVPGYLVALYTTFAGATDYEAFCDSPVQTPTARSRFPPLGSVGSVDSHRAFGP